MFVCLCVLLLSVAISDLTIDRNTNKPNFQNSYSHLKNSHLSFQVSLLSVYLSHECRSHAASFGSHGIPIEKINTAAGEDSEMNCEREREDCFVKSRTVETLSQILPFDIGAETL